jgi:hypothetical protein
MESERAAKPLGPPKKPLLTEKDVAARGWPEFAIEQFLGEHKRTALPQRAKSRRG